MRLVLPLMLFALAAPVLAQDLDPVRVEKRFGKLESEMRAVQRKVFPGGDPKFFEPEIATPAPVPTAPVGTPASAPLVDLTERVGQLEALVRTQTGQLETAQFQLRQQAEQMARQRADFEFRLNALEAAAAPPVLDGVPGTAATPLKPGAKPDPKAKPEAAKPATADAAWKLAYVAALAKKWPATEAAMTDFITSWPKSTRLPQAQYWLGKSHAARDQHPQAAAAFLQLYQTAPKSDRAPDALLGLATAVNGLKKPKDACRVLGELDSVYGAKLTPAQKAEAKTLGTRAKCP